MGSSRPPCRSPWTWSSSSRGLLLYHLLWVQPFSTFPFLENPVHDFWYYQCKCRKSRIQSFSLPEMISTILGHSCSLHTWCYGALQLESIELPPGGVSITFSFYCMCRCPKRPCWLISTAVEAKWHHPHTLWLCTSSRSPWLMESPLKRSNCSSPSQASRGNSSPITRRQTGTGTAPKYAREAPPAAIRTVRTW